MYVIVLMYKLNETVITKREKHDQHQGRQCEKNYCVDQTQNCIPTQNRTMFTSSG